LGGRTVTLPAARLYLLAEDDGIKADEVVVFAVPNWRVKADAPLSPL
jgi:hypothetical protein